MRRPALLCAALLATLAFGVSMGCHKHVAVTPEVADADQVKANAATLERLLAAAQAADVPCPKRCDFAQEGCDATRSTCDLAAASRSREELQTACSQAQSQCAQLNAGCAQCSQRADAGTIRAR